MSYLRLEGMNGVGIVVAERSPQSLRFRRIVERRRGGVRAHQIDVLRFESGIGERNRRRAGKAASAGVGSGEMNRVGRRPETSNIAARSAPSPSNVLRERERLTSESHDARSFAER